MCFINMHYCIVRVAKPTIVALVTQNHDHIFKTTRKRMKYEES